jgi:hypothetical protein
MKKFRLLIAASTVLLATGYAYAEPEQQNPAKAVVAAVTDAKLSDHGSDLVPANAKPGECYARVLVPAEYQKSTEKVLKSGAGEKLEVVPAVYKAVTNEIVVKPETYKLETVPATYKTVEEKIMVSPEKIELVRVPVTHKTVEEKILVSPATTSWKKGSGPVEKIDHSTGEIMCLVEVPAVYKTVKKVVVDTPETTKEVRTPAVYKTVTKTVLDQEATTKKVVIPAVTKTFEVNELVKAASVNKVAIPETFQTVEKTTLVKDSYVKWAPILCETNMSKDTLTKLQKALQDLKFYNGPIDGSFGSGTKSALNAYQKRKGLASGSITIESLESLGIQ